MKKYKLLKDLPGYEKGQELYQSKTYVFAFDTLMANGYLEKVEEEIKPKYKCGDYVVYEGTFKEYAKISSVQKRNDNFVYNTDWAGNYYTEKDLRLPTEEELEIYFR